MFLFIFYTPIQMSNQVMRLKKKKKKRSEHNYKHALEEKASGIKFIYLKKKKSLNSIMM